MGSLKITFLGTGTSQGVPVIGCTCEVCMSSDFRDNRTRSSVLVEDGYTRFVIDTGPDFRQQCLREKVKKLDAVLFTHEHKDHIAGLDDVRAFNFIHKMVMPIYATDNVVNALRREYAYIFSDEKYPGIPEIKIEKINHQKFNIGTIEILPVDVMHYRMPVKAFRIYDFAYITDANMIEESELLKLQNLDVLVLNALRRESHISHFTLAEAIELAGRLKAKKTYLIHMSHQLGKHSDVSKELPENMELAFDGLQIVI